MIMMPLMADVSSRILNEQNSHSTIIPIGCLSLESRDRFKIELKGVLKLVDFCKYSPIFSSKFVELNLALYNSALLIVFYCSMCKIQLLTQI